MAGGQELEGMPGMLRAGKNPLELAEIMQGAGEFVPIPFPVSHAQGLFEILAGKGVGADDGRGPPVVLRPILGEQLAFLFEHLIEGGAREGGHDGELHGFGIEALGEIDGFADRFPGLAG